MHGSPMNPTMVHDFDVGDIIPDWKLILDEEYKYMDQFEWESLSPEEKRIQLYLNQKQTLDLFLERGAISKAQYDKSFSDLTVKMGMNGIGE
jgi:hypothetical protein